METADRLTLWRAMRLPICACGVGGLISFGLGVFVSLRGAGGTQDPLLPWLLFGGLIAVLLSGMGVLIMRPELVRTFAASKQPVRSALKMWTKFVGVGLGIYLIVAIPAPFIFGRWEISVEGIAAWWLFALLSLGFWGGILLVIGALPVAAIAWLASRIARRWSHAA